MKASFKVALAIAGACLAGRAQAQTVVVGPQAGSMALLPGAQVTVPIVADLTGSGGASLGSATLRLLWHPGVLAFRGVSGGALGQPAVNADSAGGSLRVAVANPAGVTGHPVLFSATFAVVGAPGASDTLQLQLQELTGALTFADLLPGVTTAAHVCVSTGLWGDLNGDSGINGADALTILTHAVGLPITPYTTVNGDVDGDGQINTRDALIVLTYAVELPVDGFRVGAMNPGACSVQQAASVQIQPRNAAVAVGDQFPLVATVRDTAGVTVQGVDLVWTSGDTAVVKADATGHLVGTKAGAALVFAFAAPGLKDSVTVTVDSLRHVWWVNQPLAALNGGVELGSQTHPFGSIGQALARAAANDSVMIAPATYGEVVHFARPLTLVGDSTAAGATVIRNPAGPGLTVDSLPGGGVVRLDRLHIEDSQGGIVAQAGADAVLSFSGLRVIRSTGAGIAVTGAGRLLVDHTLVQGAVGQALGATGVAYVGLHAVFTDLVSRPDVHGSGVPAMGVQVSGADSLVADSLAVGTAGVWVDSARVMVVDGFQAFHTDGAGLAARIGGTFSLSNADIADASGPESEQDSVPAVVVVQLVPATGTAQIVNTVIRHNSRTGLLVLGGDSVLVSGVSVQNTMVNVQYAMAGQANAAFFTGTRRVVVQFSGFLDNNGAAVIFADTCAAMHVLVDSSAFRATVLRAEHGARLDVRRSLFQNTQGPAIQTDSVRIVSLVRVEQSGLQAFPDYGVYGGPFAVDVSYADSLHFDSVAVHDNPFGAVICRYCGDVQGTRSLFVNNGRYVWTGYKGSSMVTTLAFDHPRGVLLYQDSVEGGGDLGVWFRIQDGPGGRPLVIDSSALGGQTTLIEADGQYATGSGDSLVVSRSALRGHGLGGDAVQSYGLGNFTLAGSYMDSLYAGIQVWGPGTSRLVGNTVGAIGWAWTWLDNSPFTVDSNTITGCESGSIAVGLSRSAGSVTRNHITGCTYAVYSTSGYTGGLQLSIRDNTIVRDTADPDVGAAITVSDTYDSVVVAGDTILGGRGPGVSLNSVYNGYALNLARVDSNTVRGVLGAAVSLGYYINNPVLMRYNVLADNGTGLLSDAMVQGSANTVARNATDGVWITNPGGSAFTFANFVGNLRFGIGKTSGPPVVTDGSYWGDPLGPQCLSLCNPASLGDSVGPGVQMPVVFDTALVASAPPVPAAPLPASIFRTARPVAAVQPRASSRRHPPAGAPQPGRVRP